MEKKSTERNYVKELVELVDDDFSHWRLPSTLMVYLLITGFCALFALAFMSVALAYLYVADRQFSVAVMSVGAGFLAITLSYSPKIGSEGSAGRGSSSRSIRQDTDY